LNIIAITIERQRRVDFVTLTFDLLLSCKFSAALQRAMIILASALSCFKKTKQSLSLMVHVWSRSNAVIGFSDIKITQATGELIEIHYIRRSCRGRLWTPIHIHVQLQW